MSLTGPDTAWPSRSRRWLREPLVHFLAIGLLLFAGFRLLHPDAGTSSGRIELTEDDLRQMTVAWLPQGRPPILYREALALGPGAQKEPGSRTRSTPTAG